MADAAPSSLLFKKLRTSFSSLGGQVSLPPSEPESHLSTASKLAVLEKVLDEVEQMPLPDPSALPAVTPSPEQTIQERQQNVGLIAQVAPQAVSQAMYEQQVQLAQSAGSMTAKESVASAPAEVGSNIQYVDQEPNPEISPEVAEYLAHVEDHANQQPQEIVIAEPQQMIPLASHYPKQSVLVLPITPETESAGKRKGPLESIRWLVEWSFKMMKKFSGRIIYRELGST